MRVWVSKALVTAFAVVGTCVLAQIRQPSMSPDPMLGNAQPFDPNAASAGASGVPSDPRLVVPNPRPHIPDPRTGQMMPYDDFNPTGLLRRARPPQIPSDEDFESLGYNLHIPAKPPLPTGTSPLGDFAAETPAERMLEELLLKADAEINLGMAAYLVAADLPAFRNLTPGEVRRRNGPHDRPGSMDHGPRRFRESQRGDW